MQLKKETLRQKTAKFNALEFFQVYYDFIIRHEIGDLTTAVFKDLEEKIYGKKKYTGFLQ
jgi:hypothetical protein